MNASLHPGPDLWYLSPEGAAVCPDDGSAVIADVHLGYEWARAAGGDLLPAHSAREARERLESLLERAPMIRRLVVAGDLVESFQPCTRTARDLRNLRDWLARRQVELLPIRGDHDRRFPWPESLEIRGWTVAHGSRAMPGDRHIHGHLHPALKVEGNTFPCFLVGPSRIILPAFSANAAGLDARSPDMPIGLRCLAYAGPEWLDFGPISGRS
ncbi:MAG: phosphoesterase [Isosphaeraceae bacterium]